MRDPNMITWFARYELAWAVDDTESATLEDGGAVVHVDQVAGITEVTTAVQAINISQATRKAVTALGATVGVSPHRLIVEAADALPPPVPYLSTKAAAAMLAVSEARVRHLSQNHPLFPQRVVIPGAEGSFYRTGEIREFNRMWDRAGARGRPRRQDIAAIAVATVILSEFKGLGRDDATTLQFLLAANENGRYLREEAGILVSVEGRYRNALRESLDEDRRERLGKALAVARRLLEDG